MSVRTQLAYLAAGLTLALGLLGLLNPLLTVRIVGLEVVEPRGLSEARAVFGAMFVVLGAVMLWSVSARSAPVAYLRMSGIVMGAIAVGRLSSIVIDGVLSPLNFAFLALELLIAISTVLASFRPRGGRRPGGGKAPPTGSEDELPDALRAYRS